MNMKVLLVNGSPHEKGCTYTALGETAKTLNEEGIATEVFWIGTKPLSGCVGCKACVKLGRCVFNDCVNDFIARAAEADGFIFGTPVHYAAAGGAMTAFMDRAFYSAFLGFRSDQQIFRSSRDADRFIAILEYGLRREARGRIAGRRGAVYDARAGAEHGVPPEMQESRARGRCGAAQAGGAALHELHPLKRLTPLRQSRRRPVCPTRRPCLPYR